MKAGYLSSSIRRETRGHRNHQFDLLRIFFATLVLLSHAPEITDGDRSRELFNRMTHSGMSFGELGVTGFFLLSGFLITKSWEGNPEFFNFLRKRLLRIVPGYMVAALLSTLVVGLFAPGIPNFFRHFDHHFPVTITLLGTPMTPPVFPGLHYSSVNGSLWSIGYEFHCYLFVAIFGIFGLLKRPFAWVGATLILLVVISNSELVRLLSWRKLHVLTGDPSSGFHLSAPFFVGGCFYLLRKGIIFRPVFAMVAVVSLALVIAFEPRRLELPIILFGGYLLFYLAQLPIRSLNAIGHFPDISYGIYLYGWPVEGLWIWYHHGSPWVAFLVATLFCFGLGWLSWHFVERPMLMLKRRSTAPLPPP